MLKTQIARSGPWSVRQLNNCLSIWYLIYERGWWDVTYISLISLISYREVYVYEELSSKGVKKYVFKIITQVAFFLDWDLFDGWWRIKWKEEEFFKNSPPDTFIIVIIYLSCEWCYGILWKQWRNFYFQRVIVEVSVKATKVD